MDTPKMGRAVSVHQTGLEDGDDLFVAKGINHTPNAVGFAGLERNPLGRQRVISRVVSEIGLFHLDAPVIGTMGRDRFSAHSQGSGDHFSLVFDTDGRAVNQIESR